jgi:hypothetical protein
MRLLFMRKNGTIKKYSNTERKIYGKEINDCAKAFQKKVPPRIQVYRMGVPSDYGGYRR